VGPDTWIIVVNWNGATLLQGCLAALRGLTHPAHVLVVDNGSTDGSAAVAAASPGVEWLPLGENTGFAAANNVGLRRALAAGARHIGLVNNDVQVEPEWLARLVAAAEAHPDAGLFNGLLLFADDRERVNSTGLVFDALGRAYDRDFGARRASLATRDGPVPAVSGGAALLRADALRRIGLFDPAYFAYYEDVDLSLRARAAGIGCRYVGDAVAYHGYEKTFGAFSPRKKYLLARNHLRALATHRPWPLAAALAPALALARAGVQAPLELARGRRQLAKAQLRGAGAGALAAIEVLARRLRRGGAIPPGAEVDVSLTAARDSRDRAASPPPL
jgi:GT2 family glycosyltransferase